MFIKQLIVSKAVSVLKFFQAFTSLIKNVRRILERRFIFLLSKNRGIGVPIMAMGIKF